MILREMIDTVFSHNALVSLCESDKENNHFSNTVWEGMAHEIPAHYLDREATIFGVYGLTDGYINIHLTDKYKKKPIVDMLLGYTYNIASLYNYHKSSADTRDRFFGMLEAVRWITDNILGLPFHIERDDESYITSISIGHKTVTIEMREVDD